MPNTKSNDFQITGEQLEKPKVTVTDENITKHLRKHFVYYTLLYMKKNMVNFS